MWFLRAETSQISKFRTSLHSWLLSCGEFYVVHPVIVVFLLQDLACPSNNSASLYAVYWPERVLGRFERGYNATLLGCNLPLEVSGLYQCQLTRSRADPLNIWSIDLVVTPYEETPRPDSDLMPIGTYVCMYVCVCVVCVYVRRGFNNVCKL